MDSTLMREAGFGGGFKTYKNLTVDNGSDISGKDATGEFVEVSFDNTTKERLKTSHGKEIEGVLLLSRAVVTYRDNTQTKKKVWESEEFNPLLNKKKDGANALIPIYKLDFNGQRQKSPEGKFIVDYAFYEDLSAGKKQNIKGMDFVYTIVLYVLVIDDDQQSDIIKLRFKGKSRGNFFDYQQLLWREFKMKPAEIFSKFSVYLEKEYGKFAINFKPILQEDGQPKKYHDMVKIENEISSLVSSAKDKRNALIPPTKENILQIGGDTPQAKIPDSDSNYITATQPPIIEEPQEEEDEDEIKIKDIPF